MEYNLNAASTLSFMSLVTYMLLVLVKVVSACHPAA